MNILLAISVIKELGKLTGYDLFKAYNQRTVHGEHLIGVGEAQKFLIECRVYGLTDRVPCHSENDPVYEWRG